ncbi:MAG: YihY/virulence factor BrkB family protein [Gemmatimonadota bacterium]
MSDESDGQDGPLGPLGLLKETIKTWLEDDAIHWGASLAYYSMISLAPLVILAMTILGRVVGTGQAEEWVLEQVRVLSGPRGADLARTVIEQAAGPDLGSLGAVLTIALLLFGATAVFANLQGSLNQIWAVESKSSILRSLVRTRISAFLMILALAGMMLVSVIVSTGLSWLGPLLDPLSELLPVVRIADAATSLILLWLFVGAAFLVLPDVKISLKDVWVGALATAALLVLGKIVLASFLARNAFASMYGTAGSILLVLMWVYYSAQVFLLGAVFTKVWSRTRGRGIRPEEYAVRVKSVTVEESRRGEV